MYKEILTTKNYRLFQTVEDNDEEQPQEIHTIHILEIGFEDKYIVNDFIPALMTVSTTFETSESLKKVFFIDLSFSTIEESATEKIEKIRTSSDAQSAVNYPFHYDGADNPYEAIKVIKAWDLPFTTGNSVKYIARAGKKDPTKLIEDLEKAAWYLNEEIKTQKEK